ncbi:MAG: insulinase family protein, partial [Allosphingosinicella sp.]
MVLPRLLTRSPLLALAAVLAAPAPAAEPPPGAAARAAWGLTADGVAPHPDVRFGVLENGMRYALMRNAVPPGGLAVRFRIAAGAGDEGPRERGHLHLVEHMIFHGSETLPEGSLPLFLSHQGLRRWDDFNAYTDYGETVFRLDLARADAPAVETAVRLMREIGGRLAFTRRGVEGAK